MKATPHVVSGERIKWSLATVGASIGMAALAVLLLWAPFFYGLFNEPSQNVVSTLVLGGGVVVLAFVWTAHRMSVNFLDVAVIAYVAIYASGPFHGADPRLSAIGAWSTIALGVVYLTLRLLPKALPSAHSWILHVLAVAAVVIAVVGIANAWHQFVFPSAYLPQNGAVRLASVFQYHNTFAAFEGSIGSALMLAVLRSSNRLMRMAYMAGAGVTVMAVIEAQSRGEWIILIGLWTILLLGNRALIKPFGLFILRALPSMMPGIIVISWAMVHASAVIGWMGLALLLVLPAVVEGYWIRVLGVGVVGSNDLMRRRISEWWIVFGLGMMVMIAAVTLWREWRALMHYVYAHGAAADFMARVLYWKDSLAIFKQAPIFGLGAGAWHDLYLTVRTEPYSVTQVHSSFFQMLIDGGIIGAMIWLGIGLGLLLVVAGRSRSVSIGSPTGGSGFVFAVLAFGLFAHSLADWDMSFLYIRIVTFLALAVVATEWKVPAINIERTWVLKVLSTVGMMGCLVAAFFSWNAYRADQLTAELSHTTSRTKQLALAEVVHRLVPYAAEYTANVGRVMNAESLEVSFAMRPTLQHKALSYLLQAARQNPYNPDIQLTVAVTADQVHLWQRGYTHAYTAYLDSPLSATYASQFANAAAVYALTSWPHGPEIANAVAQKTLKSLKVWATPASLGTISWYSHTSLGVLALVVGKPSQAIFWANQASNSDNPTTREMGAFVVMAANVVMGKKSLVNLVAYVHRHPVLSSSYDLLKPILQKSPLKK